MPDLLHAFPREDLRRLTKLLGVVLGEEARSWENHGKEAEWAPRRQRQGEGGPLGHYHLNRNRFFFSEG